MHRPSPGAAITGIRRKESDKPTNRLRSGSVRVRKYIISRWHTCISKLVRSSERIIFSAGMSSGGQSVSQSMSTPSHELSRTSCKRLTPEIASPPTSTTHAPKPSASTAFTTSLALFILEARDFSLPPPSPLSEDDDNAPMPTPPPAFTGAKETRARPVETLTEQYEIPGSASIARST